MDTPEAPDHKPLKKCVYCYGDKRDALWTVTYLRELTLFNKTLKVRDVTCDEHLATACSRASSRLRVRPRFFHGPGETRIMPNGLAPTATGTT